MIDRAPKLFSSLLLALAAAIIAGCMTRPPAPVSEAAPLAAPKSSPPLPAPLPGREPDWRPQTYTVKRGDTLYQIALDHGLDYRDLAAWNNLENVNRISVGQVLVLSAPGQAGAAMAAAPAGGAVTAPLVTPPPVAPSSTETRPTLVAGSGRGNTATFKTEPRAVKLPYSPQALAQLQQTSPVAPPPVAPEARPAPPSAPVAAASPPPTTTPRSEGRVPEIDDEKLDWVWPAQGKIVSTFSETANLKGIDIAGKSGQPVVASASGKVVYAGSGLRGYGKLIIVKHNSTFLSAYAHNKEISVKEGQQVTRGQKIAEMGDTDADQVKLHFEIRRLGKPVDPTKFLPPA
jgi:lipoprotein NlpD